MGESKYSVPAVEKMLNIIELLSESDGGYSINELARLTNASLNSIYRICLELESRGYLIKDVKSGFYVLGSAFYFIGKSAEKRMDLRTNSLHVMEELCKETGETVHLTVIRGKSLVLLEQVETKSTIRVHVDTGTVLNPCASAFGKCILAFSEDALVKVCTAGRLERLTENTITDKAAFAHELDEVRKNKLAHDNEEYMEGLMCVGSPVFGIGGKCAGAIGVMLPKYRCDADKLKLFERSVRLAADSISVKMGGIVRENEDRDIV